MFNEQEIRRELAEMLGPGYPQTMRPNGQAIRELRKVCDMSQERVGGLVGIDKTRISHIERGVVDSVYTEYLYVWMKAFGCEHITDLGSFKNDPPLSDTVSISSASPADQSGEQSASAAQPADITPMQIERLQHHLLEVDKIVTLINPESITSLRDIYYRTLLLEESISRQSPTPRVAFQIETLSDLKPSASVIMGTAGQGKSILLRFLTIQEALQAKTLPLFFELRKLGPDPVKEEILKKLQNWELAKSPQELEQLLEQGRISLLFDAFDELSIARRRDFLDDVKGLHAKYPQLKIVVSARPDSGILSESWLHPYTIHPLNFTDIEALIRIYAAKDDADLMITRVQDADIKVQELLRSPIFVVLLVIRFEEWREVPRSIVAFYEDLFDALARRHNRDASGLKREISSGLQIRQLEKAFQLICYFLQKRLRDQPAHIRKVEDIAAEYADRHSLSPDVPAQIVDDIIRITNLMLEEAGICDFIHKTVKDYHAAAYVAENATDDQAELFYTNIQNKWREWSGVLWFLEHVDRIRFLRFFAIPEIQRFAPYRASEIARSFRSVRITRNDSKKFTLRFLLSETECYALTRQKQFALFASGTDLELQELCGNKEVQRISDELNRVQEVVLDWKECQRQCHQTEFDSSPIVSKLWNQKSEQEFNNRIKVWKQEVQLASAPDGDFDIG